MPAYLHHIEALLPPHAYQQDYARDRMQGWLPGKRSRRLIRGIYDHSGIGTRYSVLPDFGPGADPVLFKTDEAGGLIEPGTGARNQYYAEWAKTLSIEVSRRALAATDAFTAQDITHVVTVSCTGFSNPGPDLHVVQALGLSQSVERYHLGFMGCYAAFPALRMAQQFCIAQPRAVVLVVCLELCSLHLQLREEPDSLLANALFADGAAAALVSARPPAETSPSLVLHQFMSALAPEGESDMTWSIGDHGFDIRLSTYVPRIIGANIQEIVTRMLENSLWTRPEIELWAVHPGGRAILDKVADELELTPGQLEDARAVLHDFGNMSSATILFVLKRMLTERQQPAATPLCAMAFGPGLTVETGLFELLPATAGEVMKEEKAHVEALLV